MCKRKTKSMACGHWLLKTHDGRYKQVYKPKNNEERTPQNLKAMRRGRFGRRRKMWNVQ